MEIFLSPLSYYNSYIQEAAAALPGFVKKKKSYLVHCESFENEMNDFKITISNYENTKLWNSYISTFLSIIDAHIKSPHTHTHTHTHSLLPSLLIITITTHAPKAAFKLRFI